MSAMFQLLVGGVGVMPDPADNAALHVVPNHESGTQISFEVLSVGDVGGQATSNIELDDVFVGAVDSSFLDPGQQETGFVSLGRLTEGSHSVLVIINPGSGQLDNQSNTFDVE